MDFLSNRQDDAIRKELWGIRDSYHHYWDLLAELLQNARDAITRKREAGDPGPFFISVTIDGNYNRIEIADNGVGISKEKIETILAPGGGDKDRSPKEAGEKGVGLTYAIFSGDEFYIETRVEGGSVSAGTVNNARKWLHGEPGAPRPTFSETQVETPLQEITEFDGSPYPTRSYTRIIIGAIMPPGDDRNLFAMTAAQLKYLLRTRTAIGVTNPLFSDSVTPEFDVHVVFKLPSGNTTERLEASYQAPHLLVKASSRMMLENVQSAFVSKADSIQRRKFISGKAVWARTIVEEAGWKTMVYGVMFPDNDTFKNLSRDALGITTDSQSEEEVDALFRSGIFVSTKGMPTGISIPPGPGGRYPAYYKRCFFMVESPDLRFDLGRKSLHWQHNKKLQNAASKLFTKFEEIAPYQGDGRPNAAANAITKAERDARTAQEWADAKGLVDLGESEISYVKIPNAQEAAVAAIFHELVGAKVLKGYRTLKTGYGSRYDVHAQYVEPEKRPVDMVIEFKHSVDSLTADFSEETKHLADIHMLVAWDANEQKLKDAGFHLDVVSKPPYDGVTHELVIPISGVDAIPVILLKAFFDRRRAGNND